MTTDTARALLALDAMDEGLRRAAEELRLLMPEADIHEKQVRSALGVARAAVEEREAQRAFIVIDQAWREDHSMPGHDRVEARERRDKAVVALDATITALAKHGDGTGKEAA